jgi:hypothetical protein
MEGFRKIFNAEDTEDHRVDLGFPVWKVLCEKSAIPPSPNIRLSLYSFS